MLARSNLQSSSSCAGIESPQQHISCPLRQDKETIDHLLLDAFFWIKTLKKSVSYLIYLKENKATRRTPKAKSVPLFFETLATCQSFKITLQRQQRKEPSANIPTKHGFEKHKIQ
jgi:hypothetical protein